jgi:tetratricopeptide (TPR) repeat protein
MKAIDELNKDGGHPNLVAILRHNWRGRPFSFYYIDMELCDTNLHTYIHADRADFAETPAFVHKDATLSQKMLNIWNIIIQVTEGVAFIHSHKRVHRDLKPRNSTNSNCLAYVVLYSSAKNLWKIADFGTTVEGTSTHAQSTALARGTASYRAPELLAEEPMYTNKLDIWALGCILYELATGRPAFTGDWDVRSFTLSKSIIEVPNIGYPEKFQVQLSTAIDALLRKDWRERPKAPDICKKFNSYYQRISSSDSPQKEYFTDPFEPNRDDSEMIMDWKTLIRKNPANIGLLKRLADAYKREGNTDMEIAVLKDAVAKDPSSRYYQDQLTDAYSRREDANLSALGWKDIFERPEGWVVVESVRNKELNDLEYWKEQVYKKPGELHIQQSLVKAFRRLGDIDAEIATFNDLIRRFPGAWYLADRLADAYKKKGDMDEAIVSWKELVNMQPGNIWWQARLSESYKIKGDAQEELKTWRNLVSMYPDVESLQERLATAYEAQ